MSKKWIVIGVIVVILFVVYSSFTGKYNSLVSSHENVETSWAQVENVLQRRADLIPNLVNTVKGFAAQEKDVLTEVTKARASVGKARGIPQKIEANNALTSALSRLMVVVERYPDLKSNQNFLSLQDELAGTENRVSIERRRYNDAVKNYNVHVRRFPNNLIASFFGYSKQDAYFKADEGAQSAPKVNFGN